MNVKNNRRHRETIEKIEKAFVSLLKDNDLNKISITELCDTAEVDRSTFYANYEDVSALANEVSAKIEKQLKEQPHTDGEFAWIFEYIKVNQDMFKVYFKLGLSKATVDYKMIFFRNGAYSVAEMWFDGGCVEYIEQMGQILEREYKKLF